MNGEIELQNPASPQVPKASGSLDDIVRRRMFFIMVNHPLKGWTRVGKAYAKKEVAQSWVPFVRGAWRCCRVKVSQFTAVFRDGKLDEKSRETLDKKFNMDSPNVF